MSRRNSPEATAFGFAIGLGVAFTPTIGFQIIIACLLATFFRASRAAAILPVWITTPITIPPIFAFTYKVGNYFVDGPPVGRVRSDLIAMASRLDRHSILDMRANMGELLETGVEVFVPMMTGGLIIGCLAGLVSYPIVLSAVRRYRLRRDTSRRRRSEKKTKKELKQNAEDCQITDVPRSGDQ